MPNGVNGESLRPCGNVGRRSWLRMTLPLFGLLWLSLSACQSSPKPCDCGEAFAETERYTQDYLDALEDIGNLRQQLKACEERQ